MQPLTQRITAGHWRVQSLILNNILPLGTDVCSSHTMHYHMNRHIQPFIPTGILRWVHTFQLPDFNCSIRALN